MTAVAAAVGLSQQRPTLLVDAAGDVATACGRTEHGPGLAQWLDARASPPEALGRLEIEVTPQLAVLPWSDDSADDTSTGDGFVGHVVPAGGPGERSGSRAELAVERLVADDRAVVVDVGLRGSADRHRAGLVPLLLDLAGRSTLVSTACYLALVRARRWPAPDDLVLVGGHRRAIGSSEVAAAVGATVVAELGWDPAVARAVDAGLLLTRLPKPLRRLGAALVSSAAPA